MEISHAFKDFFLLTPHTLANGADNTGYRLVRVQQPKNPKNDKKAFR